MNAIEVKNLTKHYPNFLLDNVSFTLPSGCIMGLVGENGAGKSTTIKLLMNAVKRDGGTVSLLGGNDPKLSDKIKENIGIVLDEVGFPEFLNANQINKVMKNIYKNWNSEKYFKYLNTFSLPGNKKFKDFSRGMKMKLGIATALSHEPKLLILDEATSGLDPVIRDEMLDIFTEFTRNENHSILISSHIVSDLEKICDYIAFLHKGRMILCEEKDRLYEKYCMIQCSAEAFENLSPGTVIGKRSSNYGIKALVRRDNIPSNLKTNPIDLEELFIFMVKEAK